tara:strand:- start:1728 stop:2396 length:669 start_codon:yes stop_codon:yes gene_type:complete
MKTQFKKNHFLVIKEAIDPKVANFVYNYFLMKKQVARTFFDTRYISPFTTEFGVWSDEQVPDTYSHYADTAMETLLLSVQPKMEKLTGLKLNPTYSYARIYKKGDILHRHKDRFSCEISTTMNLGGDDWPIYLENKKNVGVPDDKKYTASSTNKGKEITLKPGDMLVYKGTILEHWREVFLGENCAQVFLHYNDVNSKDADKNIFDGRPHLGLPSYFKGFKL